jgi:hypothetical protein
VVSYGYHEHRTGDVHEALTNDGKARVAWLNRHRNLELDLLAESAAQLTAPWLLTVANKADLWWSQRIDVSALYQGSAEDQRYPGILDQTAVPDTYFLEFCSIIKRYWGEGRLDNTFDDIDRIQLRYALIRTLLTATASGS